MKKPKIFIMTTSPITVHDKLSNAVVRVDEIIRRMDGGRRCDTPTWSDLHDCKRSIQEAQEMIRQGRKVI